MIFHRTTRSRNSEKINILEAQSEMALLDEMNALQFVNVKYSEPFNDAIAIIPMAQRTMCE